jgi:putative N6-adenine-specific DNA methylase
MCGVGTIPIEAAEIARGLMPGRARAFAFELLPSHDPARWAAMREGDPHETPWRFGGSDRDDGAVRSATANAGRSGVADVCDFALRPVSALVRSDGPPGLVMTNPPYGERIGRRLPLRTLYRTFGAVMRERMGGWRVAVITSEDELARATALPLAPGPWVAHGSLRVRLWQGEV